MDDTSLSYAGPALKNSPSWWKRDYSPAESWRAGLIGLCVLTPLPLAYWFGMFWNCRSALDLFCFGFAVPLLLTAAWGWCGLTLLQATRSDALPRTRRVAGCAIGGMALLLAPYSLVRADNDMFALGVRYRVWKAGGPRRVTAEMQQWLDTLPADGVGQKFMFLEYPSGQTSGSLSPIPPGRMPPSVRYLRSHLLHRFAIADGNVARFDSVAFPNTCDVYIGPPGFTPADSTTLWQHISGSRRQIADGIWVRVGFYNK